MFVRDVKAIMSCEDYLKATNEYERRYLICEYLLDWTLCVADHKISRKIVGMILDLDETAFGFCISSFDMFKNRVLEATKLILAEQSSSSSGSQSNTSVQQMS